MTSFILIITGILAFAFAYYYLRTFENSIHRFALSLLVSDFMTMLIGVIFYYTLSKSLFVYMSLGLVGIIALLMIYSHWNPLPLEMGQDILLKQLFNIILVSVSFNLIVIKVLQWANNINFLLQSLLIIVAFMIYLLLHKIFKDKCYFEYDMKKWFTFFLIVLLALPLFVEKKEMDFYLNYVGAISNKEVISNTLFEGGTKDLSDIASNDLQSIVISGGYLYYIVNSDPAILYGYNMETHKTETLYTTSDEPQYTSHSIQLYPYQDSIYMLTDQGLYMIEKNQISPILLYPVNGIEYKDFYGVLYKEYPDSDTTKLVFETKNKKYYVTGSHLEELTKPYDIGSDMVPPSNENFLYAYKVYCNFHVYIGYQYTDRLEVTISGLEPFITITNSQSITDYIYSDFYRSNHRVLYPSLITSHGILSYDEMYLEKHESIELGKKIFALPSVVDFDTLDFGYCNLIVDAYTPVCVKSHKHVYFSYNDNRLYMIKDSLYSGSKDDFILEVTELKPVYSTFNTYFLLYIKPVNLVLLFLLIPHAKTKENHGTFKENDC